MVIVTNSGARFFCIMYRTRSLPGKKLTYTARLTDIPRKRKDDLDADQMTREDHEKLVTSIIGTAITVWHGKPKYTVVRPPAGQGGFFGTPKDAPASVTLDRQFLGYQNGKVFRYNKIHFDRAPDPIGKVTRSWLDEYGCVMIEFELDNNRLGLHQAAMISKDLKSDVSLSTVVTVDMTRNADGSLNYNYTYDPVHVALTDFGRHAGTHIISSNCSGLPDGYNFTDRDPSRRTSRAFASSQRSAGMQTSDAKLKITEEKVQEPSHGGIDTTPVSAMSENASKPAEQPVAPAPSSTAQPTDPAQPGAAESMDVDGTNTSDPELDAALNEPDPAKREILLMQALANKAKQCKEQNKELTQLRAGEEMRLAKEADSTKLLVETTLTDDALLNMASEAMNVPKEEIQADAAKFMEFAGQNKMFERFPKTLQLITCASRHHQEQVQELLEEAAQNPLDAEREKAIAALRQAYSVDAVPKTPTPARSLGVSLNSRRISHNAPRSPAPAAQPSAPAQKAMSEEEMRLERVKQFNAWLGF